MGLRQGTLESVERLMDMRFYKGKRVLVTGHTGFKGSWLCKMLVMAGAEVTGYSLNPPTDPNLFSIAGLDGKMTSVIGDIRDFEKLKETFAAAQPEIVLHLAAQPIVLTENDLCDRLADAQVGDVITYHVGMLARDRAPQTQVLGPDRCRDRTLLAAGRGPRREDRYTAERPAADHDHPQRDRHPHPVHRRAPRRRVRRQDR